MSIAAACSVLGHILKSHRDGLQATSLPPVEDMKKVIRSTRSLMKQEKTILYIDGEYEVVGDIHGDLTSLMTIFEKKGYPNITKYIFLGDYVDRGPNSIEVVLLLFALKILTPSRIYLIRGNHECSAVSKKYNFRNDCVCHVDMPFFKSIIKAFNVMPLGAVVNHDIFCVHGGIPQTDMSLEEISQVKRPFPLEYKNIQEQMLWSDPKQNLLYDDFEYNTARRAGLYFGKKALASFFEKNGVTYLIRGHEVCQEGYELPFGSECNCVTVFSSVNHQTGNLGATITIGEDKSVSLCQFENDSDDHIETTGFIDSTFKEFNYSISSSPVEISA
ncbi:Ser/Thr protein phosphatase, putative [Trichomonas vaginalis G3]|uniref:Serine/threonine-protein phosphatase n=1 Tax=Trichomonas vaginalis (strain ATCC PRA-98 / G3) TaxID=412133 RepID=A2FG24_TRIV3|nr:phosphoprotein phosphatase protein [Trichomonas vaginalis G3]EAX96143.1 Ser/Thr protein phosphatase, putative [Trichomonas vaginalis G3]KAI5507454.1 phosphoprotein phosphatase protein [Trichomonas vaginalis G3]|eukprot:XP_001309073.1 Ser/Thr protein phosphatase [Trichomonas vaginalis G3]